MPALDFTAMMSAAAALEAELAAKDASIAQLTAEHAAMAAQLDKVWTRAERLAAANDSLKTQVAALDALVSARAVAAEQQAFDDLAGSVLAEEAYAAAAAAQQQEYDDPTGVFAEAEKAEEVIDLTGEDEAAPAQGGGGAAPAAKKARAALRKFANLAAVLPEGTPLSLTSTGDRWDGVYTKDGLVFQGKAFKSPQAVGSAHAERITERHPKATKPGSGWVYLIVENGPYKGKTLAQAYDAHYSA